MVKVRINKYISDTGFCSRREADQLIIDERVTVNGTLAVLGTKVAEEDKVKIDGEILRPVVVVSDNEVDKKRRKISQPIGNNLSRNVANSISSSFHRGTRGAERKKRNMKNEASPKTEKNTATNAKKRYRRSGNR